MSSIDRRLTALEEKSAPPSFLPIELVAGPTMTKSEADALAKSRPPFDPRRDVITRIELIGVLPEAEIIPFPLPEELH